MKDLALLLQDKNFLLRFTEFIVCIIGIVIHHRYGSLSMVWGMFGWFFVSLAFIVAYLCDEPNVWTEIILLIVYIVIMLAAACTHLGIQSVMAFVAAALMIVDVIFLFIEKK